MHEFNARIADGRAYNYDSPLPPLHFQDLSSDEHPAARGAGAAPGGGLDLMAEQTPVASPASQAALDDLGPSTEAGVCFYCAVVRPHALDDIQPVWWENVQEFLEGMETARDTLFRGLARASEDNFPACTNTDARSSFTTHAHSLLCFTDQCLHTRTLAFSFSLLV